MEESAKTPYIVWKNVIPTIRKKGAIILPIFNPDWLQDETYQRMVVNQEQLQLGYFIRLINYIDNPYCPESIKLEAEVMKEVDFERYENIYLGKPRETSYRQILQGVYTVADFNPTLVDTNRNSKEYRGEPYFYTGVEWGYSQKPTAVVTCYEYDDSLYIWRSSGGVGLELDGIADCIDEHETMARRQFYVSQNLTAIKRSVSRRLSKTKLLDAEKWNSEELDRIKFLRGSYRNIFIHPSCEDVIKDFENYWWEVDDKKEVVLSKPIDENNQFIKALCHGLYRRVLSYV